MLRESWQFRFKASDLAVAAQTKRTHHESRLDFWTNAKKNVMKDIRETGIEVSESEAGSSYSNTGYGPQVMVRADLQKRLTECHQKMAEHAKAISAFKGWVIVFNANKDEMLPLHADDYLFFFGE